MAGLVNRAIERGHATRDLGGEWRRGPLFRRGNEPGGGPNPRTAPVVVTSAAATLAALVAGLIAGGSAVAVIVGMLIGLIIGAAAGAVLSSLPAGWPLLAGPPTAEDTDVDAAETEVLELPSDNTGPPGRGEVLLGSIGHRFRGLADRQLAALQELEGRFPARSEIATVTRLAARIRRGATTLLVLADHPASHETATTCSIEDVLSAAVADIEQRATVDVSSLHPAMIDGEAVPDLIHLLAELIDNAVTASEAQRTPVAVLGRRSAEGYILSIVDEGPGLDEERRSRANNLLHSSTVDWQLEAALGLSTTGRLAARHGIAVTLLEAPTDGVTAKVRLPSRLIGGQRQAVVSKAGAEASKAGAESPLANAVAPSVVGDQTEPQGASTSVEGNVEGTNEPAVGRVEATRRLQRSRANPREVTAVQRDPAPPVGRKAPPGSGQVRPGVEPPIGGTEGRSKGDSTR